MKKIIIMLTVLGSLSAQADSCRISDQYIDANAQVYSSAITSSDNFLNCLKRAHQTLQAKPDLNQVEIEHSGLTQGGVKLILKQIHDDTRVSAPIKL